MSNNPGDEFFGAMARKAGEDAYDAAKVGCNYLCGFSTNVESMKKAATDLENEKRRVEREIGADIKNADDEVTKWLLETNNILLKMKNEIEDKIPNPESGCWPNFKSRFSLGKKVVDTTKEMEKQESEGKTFNKENIFRPDPIPALLERQPEDGLELIKSRNQIEDDIVRVLSQYSDNVRSKRTLQGGVNIVGISGMGGAGKTTLAKSILRRLQSERSFPAVVEVVVSSYMREVCEKGISRRTLDLLTIQQVIMDYLDIKDGEAKDVQLRKLRISEKLKSPSQEVLIVLDDIWEAFSLEELGIPLNGGCATLITSRDKDVLQKMCGTTRNNVFEIGTLPPEEARSLFQKIAGIDLDDPKLMPVAKEVLEECGGLPLAIVCIAGALKDKEKKVWYRALGRLESSKPIDRTVSEGLHERLMLSYDLLNDEVAKLVFLLCSLYPEDYKIQINDLELYVMGIKMMNEEDSSLVEARDGVWEGVDSLVEARDLVREGVEKLKSCYLLLEGRTKTEVYMHDVLRDVAIIIALRDGLMRKGQHDNNCKWISLYPTSDNEPLDHLIGINFPNLCLLLVRCYVILRGDTVKLSDISFLKGMQGLNALSFKNAEFGSAQEEIKWPNALITLQLRCCNDLKTLSFVGGMSNLKILDCNECEVIEELPVQISQLKCLKLLNLSGCRRLKSIARGIIKELTELEELKMLGSFNKWESSKVDDDKEEGMNVSLNELEALRKLTRLEIEIDDISLAHEKMDISPDLVRYKIWFHCHYWFSLNKHSVDDWFKEYDNAIVMNAGLQNEITTAGSSWIRKLLATTEAEALQLNGESINYGNLSRNHQTIKGLIIENCEKLKELVDSSATPIAGSVRGKVFPILEHLELVNLPELTQVCDGHQIIGSKNIRVVIIQHCNKLQNLMLFERAMDVFQQLETLEIRECEAMEKVFIWNASSNEDGRNTSMTFPKLKTLELYKLPNLSTFWEGSESIEFPSLEELKIAQCEQIESLVCNGMESESEHTCEQMESVVCVGMESKTEHTCGNDEKATNNNKVKIDRLLERSRIKCCHNIRSIFSSSTIESLFNLRSIHIEDCNAIEEVFIRKEPNKDEGTTSPIIIFPNLTRLYLSGLPTLTSVGKGFESIEFPILWQLEITSCPELKRIASPAEYNHDHEASHFLFDEKDIKAHGSSMCCAQTSESFFKTLTILKIHGCHNIRSLFSLSNVENLVNLVQLFIEDCDAMEEIFRMEKTENAEKTRGCITRLNLTELRLTRLSSLISLGKGIEIIKFPVLEELSILCCPKLKRIVSPTEYSQESEDGYNYDGEALVFLFDEKVKLGQIENLILNINVSSMCCPQIRESFFKTLHKLEILGCHNIRSLFSLSNVENLVNLKELCIKNCDAMEEIFRMEKTENAEKTTGRITFLKLEKLVLERLPSLISLGKGIEIIEFPMLWLLIIQECPNLQKIVSPTESGEGSSNHGKPIPFLCNEKIKFNKLEYIRIKGCHSISSLFTFLASENLTNTTEIEKLITGESEMHVSAVLFPSLKELTMENMITLEVLCEWKCPVELPMLKEIDIKECPRFKFLTNGSLSTPNLNTVFIDNERVENEKLKDLNRFLCQYLMAIREGWTLIADVSEPSQLETPVLRLDPISPPPANAVRLLYTMYDWYKTSLVVVTSNADPVLWIWDNVHSVLSSVLWSWDNGHSSSSSVPKMKQLTVGNFMSNESNNNVRSIQDNSIACIDASTKYFAYVSSGTVAFFDKNGTWISEALPSAAAAATYLAFNPLDINIIAIGMDDSTIQIYDRKAAKAQTTLNSSSHQKRITGLAFSRSFKILVSSGADAQLCAWDIHGWKKKKSRPLQALPNDPSPIDGETRVQFHKDGYHLLVVHESHVAVYDYHLEHLRSWCPKDSLPSPVSCGVYSSDGGMIYIGFHDGAVGVLDSGNLSLFCRIAPSAYISSVIGSDINNAFPTVLDIAANREDPDVFAAQGGDPNEIALALSDGRIYVIKASSALGEAKSRAFAEAKSRALASIMQSGDVQDSNQLQGETNRSML